MKEMQIDMRQRFSVGSVILFAIANVFIVFKAFNTITAREWSILSWLIILFAGINAVYRSHLQESKHTFLYYYTLFNPLDYIISKLLYHFFFLLILFGVIIGFMTLFSLYPVINNPLFISGVSLGILGISTIFTFVSAVSSGDQENATLMSILALPLVIPILILVLKISYVCSGLMTDTSIWNDVYLLVGIDMIFVGLLVLLFPMLWRQ